MSHGAAAASQDDERLPRLRYQSYATTPHIARSWPQEAIGKIVTHGYAATPYAAAVDTPLLIRCYARLTDVYR